MTVSAAARSRARVAAASALTALLAACAAGGAGVEAANSRVSVFGAALGASGVPAGIRAAPAVEEPCLKGHERIVDSLDVSVGYGRDGKIRKITTRNPATSMFGIRPGDPFDLARSAALAAGFAATAEPHRLASGCCALTLLVGEDKRVFGLTLERRD